MPELTIESWKRDRKKIKKEKFYSQWYWGNDWLGNKVKNFYHGPRLKWMNLVKEKKNVSRERSKK